MIAKFIVGFPWLLNLIGVRCFLCVLVAHGGSIVVQDFHVAANIIKSNGRRAKSVKGWNVA